MYYGRFYKAKRRNYFLILLSFKIKRMYSLRITILPQKRFDGFCWLITFHFQLLVEASIYLIICHLPFNQEVIFFCFELATTLYRHYYIHSAFVSDIGIKQQSIYAHLKQKVTSAKLLMQHSCYGSNKVLSLLWDDNLTPSKKKTIRFQIFNQRIYFLKGHDIFHYLLYTI